ncbi:MAG: EthD family reductase [Chloroflexi bacterium]|nr:EthD family reductase [Chloroflexota bacterium]
MYKLTILFRHPADLGKFEEIWPDFVHFAEAMPGVLRVEVSSSLTSPEGPSEFYKIHEFYFDNKAAMDKAMMSEKGVRAGNVLQVLELQIFLNKNVKLFYNCAST